MKQENLYRTVWRWHFYAGIFVLPVLAWMALTGALYLYHKELETRLYPQLTRIEPQREALGPGGMIAEIERRTASKVTKLSAPASRQESWRATFTDSHGEERLAFVRPDDGSILGTSPPGGPMELIKRLHSLSVAGTTGNLLVEIVAGWAILLVLTGFYLWWPRGAERALSLAGRVTERRFWRNLHASTGLIAGSAILFLAFTGMPWTTFWGERFHAFVADQQIGRPAPPSPTASKAAGGHDAHLPWSLQGSAAPAASGNGDTGIDRALASASAAGLKAPWTVDLPRDLRATYRFAAVAERTGDIRMIHVDPGTGRVLQDIGFADFGPGAKAFEWGIYTHQGQQYGEANRLIMLFACAGLLLLTVSAPVLWWKRRGPRGLSAPPPPADPSRARGLLLLLVALGALFPLTGLTMLGALALGRLAGLRRQTP